MSIQQTNTGLARTRSVRNSVKLPLTAPQPSAAPQVPSTTSHVSLFLTNLRLLDLDQEPDWPGISPATFASRDAAGGLKNRIQSVEWALYHLFELWDGEETRKLKPFFPPADQVQSINLRAALLRSLEQVKKNGLLGRDAVLRKTMLDECKGERFEEVLAVFSSAVLKKLVAERALNAGLEYRPTISEKLALENYGYSGERTQLNALLLAHKVSLRTALKDKVAARGKYKDFEDLVASKQRSLEKRQEQVKARTTSAAEPHVPDNLIRRVRETIKDNWTGNETWAETILHNDTGSVQGGLLAADFDKLWPTVRVGRVSELEDSRIGLLEQLDQRVELQRSRIEKWKSFRQDLFGDDRQKSRGQEKKAENRPQPVDLGFNAHNDLQPSLRAGKSKPENTSQEYTQLISSLQIELDNIRKPKIPDFSKLRGAQAHGTTSQQLGPPDVAGDAISDLSEWEDEPEEIKPDPKIAVAPNPKMLSRTNSQLARPRVLPKPIARQRSTDDTKETAQELLGVDLGARRPYHSHITQAQADVNPSYGAANENVRVGSRGPHRNVPSEPPSEPKVLINPEQKALAPSRPEVQLEPEKGTEPEAEVASLAERPVSPTQAMADEILASMSNASPSPAKKSRHTLSLAERTRMTMTRTKSFDPDDDMDPNLLSPSLARSNRRNNASGLGSGFSNAEEDYDDLIARTRRSMAGMEVAQQKAQLERRRSQRNSRTVPRKDSQFARVVEEDAGETSIIEELLETQEIDAEAVFRSRPKMRTSPAPSPHRGWNEEEYNSQ